MILENVTSVDAPPAVVWEVTLDVERWPNWTPTVSSVERLDDGPFGVGSRARIKQPGMPATNWTVTEVRELERFVWETRVLGTRMTATHELAADGAGTTSTLRFAMTGALAALLWPAVRGRASRSLELENAGLKTECEAR